MKKEDVWMAKHFSNTYGNKGWAFNYLKFQNKSYSKCLSAPDATSLQLVETLSGSFYWLVGAACAIPT